MFAIVDCNNFYASCERLFRPDLRNKPIVVLSNNDGCVVARSNEAKALGIKMGEPFFKIKALTAQHHVQVFSSNYSLYGDLSQRVMSVIEETWPEVEIYSIDEAFLDLSTLPKNKHINFCFELYEKILRYTGIPTSIGMGLSKTLAKAANFIAKKKLNIPIFDISEQRHWLQDIEISDIWGIGRQWTKKLNNQGIKTAADLAVLSPQQIKNQYNVFMMRTVLELQGLPCGGLEEEKPNQSIISSKSFGQMQTTLNVLCEAMSSHAARACEKARSQHLVAQSLHVFVKSNRFRQDLTQYDKAMEYHLVNPTNDTRIITKVAKQCLKKLFVPGIFYKKVGVMLINLAPDTLRQQDLLHPLSDEKVQHSEQLMSVLDNINARFGSHTICLAAEGYGETWKMRSDMRSPCYTTRWAELPMVK